jgi:hypothetical protein
MDMRIKLTVLEKIWVTPFNDNNNAIIIEQCEIEANKQLKKILALKDTKKE